MKTATHSDNPRASLSEARRSRVSFVCAAIILLLLTTLASAKRRDPLTEAEADQVRQVVDHDPGVSLRMELFELCDRAWDRPVQLVEIDIGRGRAVEL